MNTQAVGAPAYNTYAAPMQQSAPVQQTYSTTGAAALAQTDNYQFRQYNQPQQFSPQEDNYSVINKTDLMLGAAGAVGGFFLAGMIGVSGPIGALILGVALLGISAAVRGIKHSSNKKKQQQAMQQQMQQPVQFQANNQQMYNYPGQQQPQHYIPQQQPAQYQHPQYAQQQAPQYQAAQYQPQQRPAQQAQVPPGYQVPGQQQPQSAWDKFLSWL